MHTMIVSVAVVLATSIFFTSAAPVHDVNTAHVGHSTPPSHPVNTVHPSHYPQGGGGGGGGQAVTDIPHASFTFSAATLPDAGQHSTMPLQRSTSKSVTMEHASSSSLPSSTARPQRKDHDQRILELAKDWKNARNLPHADYLRVKEVWRSRSKKERLKKTEGLSASEKIKVIEALRLNKQTATYKYHRVLGKEIPLQPETRLALEENWKNAHTWSQEDYAKILRKLKQSSWYQRGKIKNDPSKVAKMKADPSSPVYKHAMLVRNRFAWLKGLPVEVPAVITKGEGDGGFGESGSSSLQDGGQQGEQYVEQEAGQHEEQHGGQQDQQRGVQQGGQHGEQQNILLNAALHPSPHGQIPNILHQPNFDTMQWSDIVALEQGRLGQPSSSSSDQVVTPTIPHSHNPEKKKRKQDKRHEKALLAAIGLPPLAKTGKKQLDWRVAHLLPDHQYHVVEAALKQRSQIERNQDKRRNFVNDHHSSTYAYIQLRNNYNKALEDSLQPVRQDRDEISQVDSSSMAGAKGAKRARGGGGGGGDA